MAFAEVGSGTQRAVSGANFNVDVFATLAFPANVTSGNLLIVAGSMRKVPAPTSVAVTDTRGTTYTAVVSGPSASGNWRTFIAYGIAPSSGACTVTVNPEGTGTEGSFSIDEFSGANPLVSVDGGSTTAQAGAGADFTDTITTATNGELLIAASSHAGTGGAGAYGAALNSATEFGKNEVETNNQSHYASYKIVATAGAETAGWGTTANATGGTVQTLSFKEGAVTVSGVGENCAGVANVVGFSPVLVPLSMVVPRFHSTRR